MPISPNADLDPGAVTAAPGWWSCVQGCGSSSASRPDLSFAHDRSSRIKSPWRNSALSVVRGQQLVDQLIEPAADSGAGRGRRGLCLGRAPPGRPCPGARGQVKRVVSHDHLRVPLSAGQFEQDLAPGPAGVERRSGLASLQRLEVGHAGQTSRCSRLLLQPGVLAHVARRPACRRRSDLPAVGAAAHRDAAATSVGLAAAQASPSVPS